METPVRNLRVSSLDTSAGAGSPTGSPIPDSPLTSEEWRALLSAPVPPRGSEEEDRRFRLLHGMLPNLWTNLMRDGHVEQTVVVVPSMSLDAEELLKLKGAEHYEERLLFLLILLSLPRTHVVFVSSLPIHPGIIDYYLQLLPGVPFSHARRRLHMFSTYDGSPDKSLTQKILERPALVERLRGCLKDAPNAHLTVFNVTPLEKSLSVALGIPLMGADPRHLHYGSKSGCRKLFRETSVPFAAGFEDLKDEKEIAEAIVDLHAQHPDTRRVVLKINEGFSGEGNSIYPLDELKKVWQGPKPDRRKALKRVLETLPTLARMQAPNLPWDRFLAKFKQMEGVVEAFLEGDPKESPSVQLRITPLGEAQIISTHDQILGGADGQVFMGCSFPARPPYRAKLHAAAREIGDRLAAAGVVERLSIDFLAIPEDDDWKLYAVEINLRKGGTTHPFRTLQFLTGGRYNPDSGTFETSAGVAKYYVASDNLESPSYRGLTPEDLIDITTYNNLHYNSSSNTGVVFHMIGALSQYGKLGVTCVGNSPAEAEALYERTIETLERECRTTRWMV